MSDNFLIYELEKSSDFALKKEKNKNSYPLQRVITKAFKQQSWIKPQPYYFRFLIH